MRLEQLLIENFRGFENLSVKFDDHATLLLGANGAGKTAVLHAITVAFGAFFAAVAQSPDRGIENDDVRRVVRDIRGILDLQEQWPVRIRAISQVPHYGTGSLTWERRRASRKNKTAWSNEAQVRIYAESLQRDVSAGYPTALPLFAYYGTQRLWRQKRMTKAVRGIGTRFDGYADCLDIGSSKRSLAEWMAKRTTIELQARSESPSHRDPQLEAVANAVCACIEGATRFWFDLAHDEIRIERGGTIESFSMLSDGHRNMVAMIADVAERAAVLNPQFGPDAPRETAGIVLIDEIELHLHPKWQRSVIPNLRRTFPKMQFIATTHSPQVLSSVQRGQVRIFDNNRLVDAALFVEGRSSDELLVDVFGVPTRPEATERALDELFRLLDLEDYGAAQVRFAELVRQLGPDDTAMVRARWILDTEGGVKSATPVAS